jgi:hypothetical protein
MKFSPLGKMIFSICAIGFGIAHSGTSHATSYEVKFVGCTDTGTCYIGINPPLVGPMPAGCNNRQQVRFLLSSAGGEAMYNLGLSALMSGYQLEVTHHQSANTCIDGFARIWYMGPTK